MSMFGGGGHGGGQEMDWRMVGAVFVLMLCGAMTLVGDKIVFVRESARLAERVVAAPTLAAYALLRDRAEANAVAFMAWLVLLGAGGFAAMIFFERCVWEPYYTRRLVKRERRLEQHRARVAADLPERRNPHVRRGRG